MLNEYYFIIRIITVFQFLFFTFFLISLKKGKPVSNRLLSVFLFSKALCTINSLLYKYKSIMYIACPHVFLIGFSFEFLLGPSLYYYVKSLAYRDFRFKKWHAVHLIPFFLHLIFMTFRFHIHGAALKRQLLMAGNILNYYEYYIIWIFLYLQFLTYTAASLYVLSNYMSKLKNYFSSIDNIKLYWLGFLVLGFFILWSIGLWDFLLKLKGYYRLIFYYFIVYTWHFIFANIVVYKGLRQPEIFNGIEEKKPLIKYASSTLSKTDKKRYIDKLSYCMKNYKPYLIPTLSIDELSKKVSIPSRHLSQVINESLNKNFFDYINSYRIEESKRILSGVSNHKTVLEVLYDVGFNSKSVFNSVFKKYTGMTPSEFKKLHKIKK